MKLASNFYILSLVLYRVSGKGSDYKIKKILNLFIFIFTLIISLIKVRKKILMAFLLNLSCIFTFPEVALVVMGFDGDPYHLVGGPDEI